MQFDPGTTVTLETKGLPPERLDLDTVELMFGIGLTVPEQLRSPEQDSSSRLVLTGSARFLVGTLDLGVKRGLKVSVRGLATAVDTGLRRVREEKTPDAPAAEDDQQPWRVSFEPDDEDDRRQVIVTAHDLAASIDDLIEQVDDGTDVIVTQRGVQVAALVGWSWYARQGEHRARLSAAHWAALRTGRFNPTTYGREIASLRGGRLEREAGPAPSGSGEGDAGAD
ncbi:MAG TPA: type II toxin-antitoxin system prevent-host-death family antitoxin [Candidatus Limnocylindrales bacterium]